jgi:methylase of polypeptide subunit release factors
VNDRAALLDLLRELQSRDYRFVCVTPSTHRTVLARSLKGEPTLRDIFGWNRSFEQDQLDPSLFELLRRANCLEQSGSKLRSRVRVASLAEQLFLHSSYPTNSADAVFFGPDTYRFARFVLARLPELQGSEHIVEMGAGSGAVGILAAKLLASAKVTLVDVNPVALALAQINAAAAGAEVSCTVSERIPYGCDLVIANPPYMIDKDHRAYRDGGGIFGGELAVEWARQALSSLAPRGKMLLYTGAAVVRGEAPVLVRIGELCGQAGARVCCAEIDPDVFGEELAEPGYEQVERIAAVEVEITKSARQQA